MIRVGILFGGMSREREISFAGGRTVYDNLNKSLFEPVPIFVDSLGNFIHLNWQNIYKGTIRDFYPPVNFYPESEKQFQIYIESLGKLDPKTLEDIIESVGKKVHPQEFNQLFDVAFLALHGPFGEDGSIQGLLEWYGIPYTGCGIYPSAVGINKLIQKKLMKQAQFDVVAYQQVSRARWKQWDTRQKQQCFEEVCKTLGNKLVVKAPSQGSSIGVSVVGTSDFEAFVKAVEGAFFMHTLEKSTWQQMSDAEKIQWVGEFVDIRSGIGLPVIAHAPKAKAPGGITLFAPSKLLSFIDTQFKMGIEKITLESIHGENEVIVEPFIDGQEFSCIVIQNINDQPIALPPTQIIKSDKMFDYRAKYLPGITKKITPIDLPVPHIERIREECERLFTICNCNVYARIDGFFANDGSIYLNDPNTTSGMLPSSFFFHQAAEIGLNPSQFITYIIWKSLSERLKTGKNIPHVSSLWHQIHEKLEHQSTHQQQKTRIAVIMGGYSTERHISVESGRNIFEKLSASVAYKPTPVFLSGSENAYELHQIPISMMLKDNADDIREKIYSYQEMHEVVADIYHKTRELRALLGAEVPTKPMPLRWDDLKENFDAVFIALHGRPGEDGSLQKQLDKIGLPYNGSGVASSEITIDKFQTNEILRKMGFKVADHYLVTPQLCADKAQFLGEIAQRFGFPVIAKPHDDGCSSAVKKIKNQEELWAYTQMMFRRTPEFLPDAEKILHLKPNEEFPKKSAFLIESLIEKADAMHFLEITGGMLTSKNPDGSLHYEVFEPSETLASGEVLSLEEKFLAGEGQNITPARFSQNPAEQTRISNQVKECLEKAARILQVEGYCRIDAFVRIFADGRVETLIIEINSLPGMTPATCIYHQAALHGYKPYDFIDKIIRYALSSKNSKKDAQPV